MRAIRAAVDLHIQLGGGIRDRAAIDYWLGLGIDRVVLGTAALRDPELVRRAARDYPGRIVVGIDARDGRVAVEGWAETSEIGAVELGTPLRRCRGRRDRLHRHRPRRRADRVDAAATAAFAREVGVPVIASGGVASLADIAALKARAADGIAGAICGRALYDGRLDPRAALRLLAERPPMLKMRVIPCLDVKDGRVVKGVNFVDLTDAGDPVEQARLYDREGADELCFLDITASHEGRDTLYDVVAPHRRAMLHAADRRRRRAHGRGHPQAAAGRRRQGVDQHRRRRASRIRARGGREIRQPVHRRRDRRESGRRRANGTSSPMADGGRPGSTRSNGPAASPITAPARSC